MNTSPQTNKTSHFFCMPKTWSDKINILVAATTLLLAACATIASFKAAGYGNQVVLAQNQASDLWAFYQAKSIKETIYKQQLDSLNLQASQVSATSNAEITILMQQYADKIDKYQAEEKSIADEAKALETKRNFSQSLNAEFGRSLIFLQVAILLSSMSAIMKYISYWYAGLGVGLVGIGMFFMAFIKTL